MKSMMMVLGMVMVLTSHVFAMEEKGGMLKEQIQSWVGKIKNDDRFNDIQEQLEKGKELSQEQLDRLSVALRLEISRNADMLLNNKDLLISQLKNRLENINVEELAKAIKMKIEEVDAAEIERKIREAKTLCEEQAKSAVNKAAELCKRIKKFW